MTTQHATRDTQHVTRNTPPTPPFPWRRTFLLGFGFFGISVVWPIYDSLVPLLLAGFGLSNRMLGTLMTVDNYFNMFVNPWIGLRSDRTRTRIGRRFPYILVGAPLAAVGMALIPIGAGIGLPAMLAAMFLMTFAMALFRAPTVALLGDMFAAQNRAKANGVINFMGVGAAVLAFLIGGRLFDIQPSLPFVAAGVTMVVVLALLMTVIREPEAPEIAVGEREPGLRDMLAGLATNPDRRPLTALVALAAWSVGLTAIQAFWTLFGSNELGLSGGSAAQLLSFYPLAGLLFAIPGGLLGHRYGRRGVIVVSLGLVAALLSLFLLIPADALAGVASFELFNPASWFATSTMLQVILLLMGVGAGMTIVTVNILPLLLNVVPEAEHGRYTGLYYFFASIASVLGPPLGGQLSDMTGTYRSIFFLAPISVVVGALLIARVREQPSHESLLAVGQ